MRIPYSMIKAFPWQRWKVWFFPIDTIRLQNPDNPYLMELASLSIFPATPEQIVVSRKRSFAQWARGLTEEQYLQRDAFLDELEHAANGKLTTWLVAS